MWLVMYEKNTVYKIADTVYSVHQVVASASIFIRRSDDSVYITSIGPTT
jgi:hypothetical protein